MIRNSVASFAVAVVGIAVFALLMRGSAHMLPGAFGADIYDQFWLALREGRIDLPARVLRIEGHYLPDGTAMPYHGAAPLLTRLVLDPFVRIGSGSLAPFSVWIWASLGTLAWHLALQRSASAVSLDPALRTIMSVMLWFGGPGVILAANHSFYHEPISVAYATTGIFAACWVGAIVRGRFGLPDLLLLALMSALTVHARPNLAIGLYLATCIATGLFLFRSPRRSLLGGAAAMSILLAGGAGYLALNQWKFGSVSTVHGSFRAGEVQYGMAFWEMETAENPRQLAYDQYGRFNLHRVLPNGAIYLAAPPSVFAPEAHAVARELHGAVTLSRTGYGRIEPPTTGMVFLWTFWIVLAALGLASLLGLGWRYLGLVAGFATGAVLTMSFPAMTLRYLVDLWPFVASLAILGLARLGRRPMTAPRLLSLSIAGCIGIALTLGTSIAYTHLLRTYPDSGFAEWSAAECRERAGLKGLSDGRIAYVCREPSVENRR